MPVIDTHAHWYAKDFVTLLEAEAAQNGGLVTRNKKGNPVFALPGVGQKSTMKPEMIEPGLMIKSMDERRIDAYVLSPHESDGLLDQPAVRLKLSKNVE